MIDSAEATWRDLYQGATSRLGSGPEARWILEEAAGVAGIVAAAVIDEYFARHRA